jgi:predicted ribosomally synthesized peptide with nif11-like leader
MTPEQIQSMVEAVKSKPELQSRLQTITSFEEAAALAKEAGFTISSEQLKQSVENGSVELSDSELETVAGGGWGKLIKSIADGGESCGHAIQKLTCNIIETKDKLM